MRKKLLTILSLFLIFTILTGCGNEEKQSKATIVVGSKDFTESLILAEIYSLALEDNGYEVDRKFNISSAIIHQSITSNEIDIYPEYTGTGLLSVLKLPLETDPQKVYETVKEEYKKQFNIEWLNFSSTNDGMCLVISTQIAEKYNIKTISDLQNYASKLVFTTNGDFMEREDGMLALEEKYGTFDWKEVKTCDTSLQYELLSNGQADVLPGATTNGKNVSKEYTVLEDDKQVWPPYNIVPIIRGEILTENLDIADILNVISQAIDTETITQLNAKVDVDKEEYEDVAKEFYESIK